MGRGACATGKHCAPMTMPNSPARCGSTPARSPPLVTWGTSPEQVSAVTGRVPRAGRDRARGQAPCRGARARLYGVFGRRADHRHRDRPRLHRLLHQCAHRGFARGRARRRRAGPVNANVQAMIVPGSGLVKRQAEAEGLDRIFKARRLRLARARLLDVPRDESRQARARRALRLDVEPQFRGPPGPQGPHPSGLTRHGGGGRDRRPVRRRAEWG